MSRATYRWKPGSQVRISAQVAGEELARLEKASNSGLTPEGILQAATPRSSPLHDAFEWDNAKAARAHRIEQAKYLARSIEVVVTRAAGEETPIRALVSVSHDADHSYVSTVRAMSQPELRAQVVARAWRDLQSWHDRYSELAEFARVFDAISEARPV